MKKGSLKYPDRDFLNRKEKLQEELIEVYSNTIDPTMPIAIFNKIKTLKQQLAELKEEEPKQSAEEIKFAELSENLFNLAALDNGWLECSLSPQDCITLLDWFKVNVLTKYRQQGMPTEEEAGKANSELLQKRLFREEDINPVSYSLGFKDCAKWALNKWKGDK